MQESHRQPPPAASRRTGDERASQTTFGKRRLGTPSRSAGSHSCFFRIRRVDTGGTITTIAGTGEKGFSAEHGTATEMMLDDPAGLALGPPGILYIADLFNARIRALRYDLSKTHERAASLASALA